MQPQKQQPRTQEHAVQNHQQKSHTTKKPHSWAYLQVRCIVVVRGDDVCVGIDAFIPELAGPRQVIHADLVLLHPVLPGHPVVPVRACLVLALPLGPVAARPLVLFPVVGLEIMELAEPLAEVNRTAVYRQRKGVPPWPWTEGKAASCPAQISPNPNLSLFSFKQNCSQKRLRPRINAWKETI